LFIYIFARTNAIFVLKELFNVQIGKVSRVTLTYGQDGKSKGVATIQFAQKGDAKKAYDRYDGKLIDNSKRLKVPPSPNPHALCSVA
jgi:THO complex subunit 4